MRTTFRRALGAAALALAVTAMPVSAESPVESAVETGEDTVALTLDAIDSLSKGCNPIVTKWTPLPFSSTPFIRNGSTYYRHLGGGTAHLSCSATVKIQARIFDASLPGFKQFIGKPVPTYVTSRTPYDYGSLEVPYFGPDAPVMRPFGKVTVRVEVFRKLATGRYAKIYNGCNEWRYVVQPAASLTLVDPTDQSACASDGAFLVSDTAEEFGVEQPST